MTEVSNSQLCQTPEHSIKSQHVSTPILSPIPIKRKMTSENEYFSNFKITPFRSPQTKSFSKLQNEKPKRLNFDELLQRSTNPNINDKYFNELIKSNINTKLLEMEPQLVSSEMQSQVAQLKL